MRKLLFILALMCAFSASAQETTTGLTGKLGAFHTFTSSSQTVTTDIDYGPGLQLELGVLLRKPVTPKSFVQLTPVLALERQSGGDITLTDSQQNPIASAKTRYGNFSVGAGVLYFYRFGSSLAVGTGVAAKYKLAAIMAIQKVQGQNRVELDDAYDNFYHRKLHLYLPLEAQLVLSPKLELLGQLQVPGNNRVAASESAFKERDLGFVLGLNYLLE